MAKTSVDLDMEKLDRVREILGTESVRETISAAFREVIRVAAVRDLVALGAKGLEILHYDRDIDTVARFTEQPARWIVPPGSV